MDDGGRHVILVICLLIRFEGMNECYGRVKNESRAKVVFVWKLIFLAEENGRCPTSCLQQVARGPRGSGDDF